eukprot:m.287674 g.287674  ORF g.287674 m.287674 type:complete len:451 (-) comp11825_c0_seq1:1528-2880(-)
MSTTPTRCMISDTNVSFSLPRSLLLWLPPAEQSQLRASHRPIKPLTLTQMAAAADTAGEADALLGSTWRHQQQERPKHRIKDMLAVQDPWPVRIAAVLIFSYIGIGCVYYATADGALIAHEDAGFVNAFYFVIVSLTTVGYGDLKPQSVSSRLFTCVFAFYGVAVIGYCLGLVFSILFDRQDKLEAQETRDAISRNFRSDSTPRTVVPRRRTLLGRLGEMWRRYHALPDIIESSVLILVVLAIGIGLFYWDAHLSDRHITFLDALYFSCISVTTIGYGDFSWTSDALKMFGALYLIVATMVFAHAVSTIANIPLERRRRRLEQDVINQYGNFLSTSDDLLELVSDRKGFVTRSDFILRLLCKLDKVNVNDILECGRRFDLLDTNHSGTLSLEDVRAVRNWELVSNTFRAASVLRSPAWAKLRAASSEGSLRRGLRNLPMEEVFESPGADV